MKKNALLTLLLGALLGLAYFLDHKKEDKKLHKKLFSIQNFKEIKLLKTEIEDREGDYFIKGINYPASKQKVSQLRDRLNSLSGRKLIKGKERISLLANDLFSASVKFSIDDKRYEVSQVNELTGIYFLWNRSTDEIYEVSDSYVNEGVYKTEVQADILKYQNLISYLTTDYQYYIYNRIAFNFPFDEVKKIEITNSENFAIDLERMETSPKAYKGLLYNVERINRLVANIKGLNVLDIKDQTLLKKLKTKVAEFNFDNQLKFSLHQTLGNTPGHFIVIPGHRYLYQIAPTEMKIFTNTVQYYWQTRIHYLKKVEMGLWNNLEIIYPNGKLGFEIKLGEKLQIRAKNGKNPDKNTINQFLSLLTGLKPVREVKETKPDAQELFKLNINGMEFTVLSNKVDFIVSHKELFYHYDKTYFSSSLKKEEFFPKEN